jgi:hypothetical protein
MLSVLHAQKTLLKTGLSHIFVIISQEVKLRRKISKNQLKPNVTPGQMRFGKERENIIFSVIYYMIF